MEDGKGEKMTHRQISGQIRRELRTANKSLTTAKRFGNTNFYKHGESKLRHAEKDIKAVGTYRVSRVSALRHIVGFSPEKTAGITFKGKRYPTGPPKYHPPGCMCPFHGGHR